MAKKIKESELPVEKVTFSFQSKGKEVETEKLNVQVHTLESVGKGDFSLYIREEPKMKFRKSASLKTIKRAEKPVEYKKMTDEEFLELAVSVDEARPVLTVSHKKYAADGFRMHILEDAKFNCKCEFCKNKAKDKSPMTPDFTQIIPRYTKGEFTLDRQAILDAVNQCRIFSREGSNVMKILIKADCIEFSATSEEFGESITHYDNVTNFNELGYSRDLKNVVYNYTQTGNELLIAFNCDFVLDAVKGLGEKVTVKYSVANAPALFTDGKRTALLMPMHLG